MAKPAALPIFDGHNDSLTRFHKQEDGDLTGFLRKNQEGHLDLPRALEAGLVGGLFAIHAPDSLGGVVTSEVPELDDGTAYSFDLPPELDQALALKYTLDILSGLEELVAASHDRIKIVKDARTLRACIDRKQLAMVLHIEGAEDQICRTWTTCIIAAFARWVSFGVDPTGLVTAYRLLFRLRPTPDPVSPMQGRNWFEP